MRSDSICCRHGMLTLLLGIGLVGGAAMLACLPASVGYAQQPAGGEDVAEPYVVYVAHEAVYARCGPDGEYYRTDPLRLGQQLEVYLETEEGWLGIRPPENSFSWVPADDIELSGDEQTGVVSGPKTVAWIGTHLGRARKYRWQVQLPRGEEVAVIGKSEHQKEDETETWYRIVPPSGEFRWVHRTQIAESTEQLVQMHRRRRNLPSQEPTPADSLANGPTSEPGREAVDGSLSTASAEDRSPSHSLLTAEMPDAGDERFQPERTGSKPSDSLAELQAIDRQPVGSGLADAAADEAEPQRAANRSEDSSRTAANVAMVVGDQVRVREIGADRIMDDRVKPPASGQQADDDSWVTGERPSADQPIATVGHASALHQSGETGGSQLQPTAPPVLKVINHETPEDLQAVARRTANADTAELQLELSRQLAAGASARMVAPIRKRAEHLIETLEESVQRGHARLVLERVEQYQRVARRRDGDPEPIERPDRQEPTAPATAQTAAAEETAASGFVRTGYLVQVYSARPQAPPYALNDASGRTLAYVSPALGVRLRGHLNRHVGLKGETTFDTGLNTPHIIANQAVPVRR